MLKDYNAKINFQVSSANMFSAYWFLGDKIKLGRANPRGLGTETASHTRDQGNVFEEDSNYPHGFLKIEDNHVFSPSFMLNVKASHYNTGFGLVPVGGLGTDEGLDIVRSIVYGSSKQFQSIRPQDTINVDASYFRGNHELKFGFAYRRASVASSSLVPGTGIEARTETARGKIARIQRELVSEYKGSYHSLYLQDTFTSGPPDGPGRRALGPPEGRERAFHGSWQSPVPGDPARSRLRRLGVEDLLERHLAPRWASPTRSTSRARRSCVETSRSSASSSPCPT